LPVVSIGKTGNVTYIDKLLIIREILMAQGREYNFLESELGWHRSQTSRMIVNVCSAANRKYLIFRPLLLVLRARN
jgi:hypothetical protein